MVHIADGEKESAHLECIDVRVRRSAYIQKVGLEGRTPDWGKKVPVWSGLPASASTT